MTIFDDTFDFHNEGLLEPNQIFYILEKFINDSHDQNNSHLLIITGKADTGSGLVKRTVLSSLKKIKMVKKFRIAFAEDGGSGAVEVWLKD